MTWISRFILPIAILLCMPMLNTARAQYGPICDENNGGFSIDIDTIATNIGLIVNTLGDTTDLTGYNTYRLYLQCESQADLLQAVVGDAMYPTTLTTTTSFFQAYAGYHTEHGVNSLLFPIMPELEFDSFLTIGLAEPANPAQGETGTSIYEDPDQSAITGAFEDGENLMISSFTGAGWLIADAESATNCEAGPDQKVMFAQVTTDGTLEGTLRFQAYRNGFQSAEWCIRPYLSIPNYFSGGCMNEEACNYDELVTFDDGSCDFCSCSGEPEVILTSTFPSGSLSDYSLEVDIVANHDTTGIAELEGMKTYRVFVQTSDSSDLVTSVFGDAENPLEIQTTDSFFHSFVGGTTPNALNPILFNYFPSAQYDTWVTIGIDQIAAAMGPNYSDISTIEDPNDPWASDFDPGNGQSGHNIVIQSAAGGVWFASPNTSNVVPDADGRVLIAQFTSTGVISGTVNVQILPLGNYPGEDLRLPFSFTTEGLGEYVDVPNPLCACDTIADVDGDGVCDDVDPCIGVYDYCGVCEGPGPIYDCGCFDIPDGACDCAGNVLDILGVCGGGCESDVDEDGVCDSDEVLGCTDPEACNFSVLHTEEDGSCLYLDALGVCGGDCEADVDGNGLCDTQDALHCGTGTHWDSELGQCIITCSSDVNLDGAVAVGDLLDLLADFGYF